MAYEYEVAFSFAGEDRPIVKSIAELLQARGVSVFYDAYEEAALWGRDLYQHLADVYRNRAKYCVIVASEAYARKVWPKHELASAQARALTENREYILPARLDDTEIPGLLPTTAYVDLRSKTPEQVAELICRKLATNDSSQELPLVQQNRESAVQDELEQMRRELQQLRKAAAGRELQGEAANLLQQAVAPLPKIFLGIFSAPGDQEGAVYREHLAAAFRRGGWSVDSRTAIHALDVVGVQVAYFAGESWEPQVPKPALADQLASALSAAGVEVHVTPTPGRPVEYPVFISVGRKPRAA